MASVRAEGKVVNVEAVSFADSGSFLTDREVGGTGVIVVNSVIFALYLDLVEHGFKFANGSHIAINAHKIGFRVDLLFLVERFVVSAEGNIVELGISRREHL